MEYTAILNEFRKLGNPKNKEGMARFGINVDRCFCVSIPNIRNLAKKIGKNHELALKLWEHGYNESRLLAGMIDEPAKVTEEQMESWVKDFNSWDICDQTCSNLFDKVPFYRKKLLEWVKSDKEFVKRAGFVLMATSAVHDKKAADSVFISYLPITKKESVDERNYVRKAVNWALRQIGKRNKVLNKKAIECAREIQKLNSKSARWIANDAIRELKSDGVKRKLARLSPK
jgi:3-methyladenine DNA glycosylase AlkD